MNELDFDQFMSYLRMLLQKMQKDFNSELKHFGISSTHIGVIKLLNEKKIGYSMSELCRILKVDNALMTRNIKELEKINYVYRNKEKETQRKYHICLTKEGQKVANDLEKIVKEKQECFKKQFSEEEQQTIELASKIVVEKLMQIIEKEEKEC